MASLTASETVKLQEIEKNLAKVKYTYEEILPIFHVLHRKKLMLELEIKTIEQAKMDLLQGQLELPVVNSSQF